MNTTLKNLFRKLTPLEVATKELTEAELSKLNAQTAQDYACAMVDYESSRIKRLKSYINTLTKDDAK